MPEATTRPTFPILDQLPPGTFVEETPGGVLALSIDYARALHERGFTPDEDGELRPSDLHGRTPLHELDLGDERLVVRRFSHGGLLRWATGARFADPERPFRELILSHALHRSGVSTALVVAARARRALPFGWRLDLVTRRVEGSLDLALVLDALGRGEVGPRARRRLVRSLGELLRRLHRYGLLHADLQPRNLLVREADLGEEAEGPVALHVIDLDRSAFVERLTDTERRDNLRRLWRAVQRRSVGDGPGPVSRTDLVRFLTAYDPEGARWKEDWRRIAADHARNGLFHRLGQALEGLFGGATRRRRLATEA